MLEGGKAWLGAADWVQSQARGGSRVRHGSARWPEEMPLTPLWACTAEVQCPRLRVWLLIVRRGCYPREAEAGGQPGLHGQTLSHKDNKEQRKGSSLTPGSHRAPSDPFSACSSLDALA